LFMEKKYVITPNFMYMRGHNDRFGKTCTEVHETNRTFLVDMSPLEILALSIKCIGYNLSGAIETSRDLLGDVYMCPILVNPIDRIVVFPTRTHKHEDTIWFNPFHIKRTRSFTLKTNVLLSNGSSILVPTKLSSFNTKIQNAEQLQDLTVGPPKHPVVFLLDPKKRKKGKKKQH
jgi:competence protein ComK